MNFLPNKFLMVGSELEFNQSSYCQVGKVLKNLRTSYQQAFSKRSCGRNSSKRRQYFLSRRRKSVPKSIDFLPAGGELVGSQVVLLITSYRQVASRIIFLRTSYSQRDSGTKPAQQFRHRHTPRTKKQGRSSWTSPGFY